VSLRARFIGAIALLVLVTLVAVWAVFARGVFRPFERGLYRAFQDQVVDIGRRVDAGDLPETLSAQLGLDIHLLGAQVGIEGELPAPLGVGRRGMRHPPGALPGWAREQLVIVQRGGYALGIPPGPRDRLLVRTTRGWLMVRRDVDIDGPARQLGWLLPLIGVVVFSIASLLASWSTRPLRLAQTAMDRVTAGELGHRLAIAGPPELARVAGSFNQMADRIEGLLRTERELLAGVSHELRTPLARLRLEVELLRDAGASERRLVAMEGDLSELDALIGELLELSRLQLGDRVLDPAPVDLGALVDAVLAHPAHQGLQVTREGAPITIRGDAKLLERALGNLLQNARRYAGGVAEVRFHDDGLEVLDRGPGVAPELLPRLFDPFFRVEGSRAKASGGVGLGLMIVRQVVDLHGGTLTARNRDGGGLAVRLRLYSAT